MPRLVIPGIYHYIIQRGHLDGAVFHTSDDSLFYLETLASMAPAKGLDIQGWCLTPDAIRIIANPDNSDSIRATVAETNRRYARYYYKKHGADRTLWQERFHSFPMEDNLVPAAIQTTETTPAEQGLCTQPGAWRWSSANARLRNRPDPLIREDHIRPKVEDWATFLDRSGDTQYGALAIHDQIARHAGTGRPLGSPAFIRELEHLTGRRLQKRKPGPKPAADSASKSARHHEQATTRVSRGGSII